MDVERHIHGLTIKVLHVHVDAVRVAAIETFTKTQFDVDAAIAEAQAGVAALRFTTDVSNARVYTEVERGVARTWELIVRFGEELHGELALRIAHRFALRHLRFLAPR